VRNLCKSEGIRKGDGEESVEPIEGSEKGEREPGLETARKKLCPEVCKS